LDNVFVGLVFFGLFVGVVWAAVWICIPERPGGSKGADGARETESQRETQGTPRDPCWPILGVSPQAGLEEITRSYRRALHMYHPDRLVGLAPELIAIAECRTKELNAAFSQAKLLHKRTPQ
jgi:hypothetical protein